MAAYLIENPPAVRQWYAKRNRPLTGCTVLHTAEGVLDTVGPDTGAEATAEYIRRRTTPGSYHDLVDADSWVPLVPYEYGAFHDGTGSNNWALSLSFACRTTDWRAMTPERRAGFLRQGARAFAAQQAWRRSVGAPLTELRLISKAQSDAGESGFIYHGWRDPPRRTDPGVSAPDLFPFDEFIGECRTALSVPTGGFLMALNDDQQAELYNLVKTRLGGAPLPVAVWDDLIGGAVQDATGAPQGARHVLADVFAHARAAVALSSQLAARDGAAVEELAAELLPSLAGLVRTLPTVQVQELAAALADEQDRRARDGDPATGPVS